MTPLLLALLLTTSTLDFDAAFADPNPTASVHFTATYTDAHHTQHTLEEWREGRLHLRRRTDGHIDLHADAESPTGQLDYTWQVLDLQKKTLHRITSQQMLDAGLLYNFWSLAHVIGRPPGRFQITPADLPPLHRAGVACTWYTLAPDGVAPARICWSAQLGLPLRIDQFTPAGTWTPSFQLRTLDLRPIALATFTVDPSGLRVKDVGQVVDRD